jgi:hypothetical protein
MEQGQVIQFAERILSTPEVKIETHECPKCKAQIRYLLKLRSYGVKGKNHPRHQLLSCENCHAAFFMYRINSYGLDNKLEFYPVDELSTRISAAIKEELSPVVEERKNNYESWSPYLDGRIS